MLKIFNTKGKSLQLGLSKESEILIEKNEIIGYSGNTGSSSGPHLHFELRDKNNMPVNPLKYRNIEIIDTIIPSLKVFITKNLNIITANLKTITLDSKKLNLLKMIMENI